MPNENKRFDQTDPEDLTMPGRRHSRRGAERFSGNKDASASASAWSDAEDMTMPGRRKLRRQGDFLPGEIILKRYRVVSELGRGGMGVVYKCFDSITGVDVAMKMLQVELSADSVEMEELRENFQLIHTLHHPNIAASNTLEYDSANGILFLVMECVEGIDLRRWIKEKRSSGDLSAAVILPVIRQIASALDFAHKQNILHRDIKPGNVMITPDGTVKVLDFGLATQISAHMTCKAFSNGETSGTAPYMAPEQWRGGDYSPAVDQYALGVLTYELLAGRLPFRNPEIAILREIVLNEKPAEIPGLPGYVQKALQKILSKKKEQRFPNCSAFADALSPVSFRKVFLKKYYFPVLAVLLCLTVSAVVYAFFFTKTYALPPEIQKQLLELEEAKKKLAQAQKKLQDLQHISKEERVKQLKQLEKQRKELEVAKMRLFNAQKSSKEKAHLLFETLKQDIKIAKKHKGGPRLSRIIANMNKTFRVAEELLNKKEYNSVLIKAQDVDKILKEFDREIQKQSTLDKKFRNIEKTVKKLKELEAPRLASAQWQEAENLFSAGKQQFENDEFEKAKANFQKAEGIFLKLHSEVPGLKKEELFKIAEKYRKEKKWQELLTTTDRFKSLALELTEKENKTVQAFISDAQQNIRQTTILNLQNVISRSLANGRLQEADQTADKLLKMQPSAPLALYAKGRYALENPATLKEAYACLRGSAESGMPHACLYLGHWYSGQYDSRCKDPEKAFTWYRKAAEKGIVEAQFQTALYLKSKGTELPTAFAWLQNSANKGNPGAAFELADCYEKGLGTEVDTKEAFKWYKTAAEKGIAEAQFRAALSLKNQKKELAAAFRWFKSSAEKGNINAAFELAVCYEKGTGTAINRTEAFKYYKIAAAKGHAAAQFSAGRFSPNLADAITWYQQAARQGIPEACYELGLYYDSHPTEQKHRELADKWMTDAASAGIPGAHKYLGDRALQQKKYKVALKYYRNAGEFPGAYKGLGDCFLHQKMKTEAQKWYEKAVRSGDASAGVPLAELLAEKNPETAFKHWYDAAKSGSRSAQYHVAECFFSGRGVKKDLKKAFETYRTAVISGVMFPELADAQYKVGLCCFYGYGTKKDPKEAVGFFEAAAQKGHREAQRLLADCFDKGTGVKEDQKKAVFWYEKAAAQGDSHSNWQLGKFYAPADREKSLKYYRAAGNHPGALLALAVHNADLAGLKKLFSILPEEQLKGSELDFSLAHYHLGKEALKHKKNVEAFFHFSKITVLKDSEAQLFLGDVFAQKGDTVSLRLAFIWYQRAAASENTGAMFKLALCFLNGTGTRQDRTLALDYFRKAAAKGSVQAMYWYGKLQKDMNLIKKAAAAGSQEAQFILARYYTQNKENVPAFNNYRKAAELGHPEAQLFLGECYANGTGTARDTAKAKEWFQKAAVQESKEIAVKAQFALAQLYEITFDGMEKAVEYYSKAAENGHAQAQLALAKRYVQQENYELAVYWLRKYLEKNTDPEICVLLADIYYEGGRGVIPDHAEAEKYYLMAAEKKHVEALLKLGVIYYTASTPDHKKAFRYFYEAAFLGNREAQYNLGVCYLKGSGTARDTEKAREWIRKAAVQGHPNAIKVLPKLN